MKKMISRNVNGLRACMGKGFAEFFAEVDADVFCIQESKAQPEQIDVMTMQELGYQSYIHSAEKKGYSGVAIFTRIQPDRVVIGMGNHKYDCQGRVIRADYGDITVICVYIPSGEAEGPKYEYKMDFLADFLIWINELRKERPNIVVCGDYNIAHKPIDINHPERQVGVSGFLPEEREWLTHFIEGGMIDSFRVFDSRAEQYSWWTYRMGARKRNAGWRIDYFVVSERIKDKINEAKIHTEIFGSDHCPVELQIDL